MKPEELAKILRKTAEECAESAQKNPSPYSEAFDTIRIVLVSLANRIEALT